MEDNGTRYTTQEQKEKLAKLGIKPKTKKVSEARNLVFKKLRQFSIRWEKADLDYLMFTLDLKDQRVIKYAGTIPKDYKDNQQCQYEDLFKLLDYAVKFQELLEYSDSIYNEVVEASDGEYFTEMEIKSNKKLSNFFDWRGINFKNVMNYNHEVFGSLEEIILFEYILFRGLFYRKQGRLEFFHSKRQFREHIKIKEHRLDAGIKKLKNMGIITTTKKGLPQRTYFKLCLTEIVRQLPNILNNYQKSGN